MPGQLLDTKLHVPRSRHAIIPRPRLDDRISRGTQSTVTLISAPAGFGKTTLITEWLASRDDLSAGWVSLDVNDNDPVVFWAYVLAALDVASPGVSRRARSLLDVPRTRIDDVLTRAINDLGHVRSDIVLVLDDYHEIRSPEIHRGLGFAVDHLPPRIHLVITTRADPPLQLARLRARGELVDIRAADLRFTRDEAAAFLGGPMGLVLSTGDVDALERRTEGWVAALQLAGLSIQGRDDPEGFIAGFAGDDRFVVDYLAEEVLQHQAGPVRDFLLRTSVLERLTGPLCDAVTGRRDGRGMLDALDRANLFLIPLDERRRWYRYHHLFADMLRTFLMDESPDEVPELHRRASHWYAQNGEGPEAIRHAMIGGHGERAAELIESAIPDMRRTRQETTLRGWLAALPRSVLDARPVLSLAYAGTLMQTGTLEGVEELLRAAERWLDQHQDGRVATTPQGHRVPVELAMYRAALALMSADPAGTVAHARRALELSDAADHLGRGAAAALLGLAHWTDGDLDAAQRRYAEAMVDLERAGFLSDVLGCAVALADMQVAQGRLDDAAATYERGLAMGMSGDGAPLRGVADMHTGLGELARERDDRTSASEHLRRSQELGDDRGLPQNAYRSRLLAARIRQSEGDLAGALDALDETRHWHTTDMSPDVRPIAAMRARLLIAQGDLDEARAWARREGLATTDPPDYLREFELATLVRLIAAEGPTRRDDGRLIEAVILTDRLLAAAEAGSRHGSVLDLLVAKAIALQARGDVAGALASLSQAMALAEPHGHVRIFLDEGPRMVGLLRLAPEPAVYARRLLAAAATGAATARPHASLVEPLSERELDVLRLLEGELDGPGIANELVVSVNTVRTHTKHIYAKLGVNDRRAAVRRARELGLLGPDHRRGTSA